MQIGCSLYSFDFVKLPTFSMFFKACMKKMVRNRVNIFELPIWSGFSLEDSINIKKMIPDNMKCYAVHLPKTMTPREILNQRNLLEGVFNLAPSVAVIHVFDVEELAAVSELERIFLKQNCQLSIEFIAYNVATQIMFSNLDPEKKITLDLYHCYNAGFSVEDVIKKYRKRICHVHLNDYYSKISKVVCPSTGKIIVEDVIEELCKQDYQGVLMIECGLGSEENYNKVINDMMVVKRLLR